MKKRIVFLSLFAILFSCNDATEIVQEGELNDQRLFTNVDNIFLLSLRIKEEEEVKKSKEFICLFIIDY